MKVSDVGSSLFLMTLGGGMAWQAEKLSIGTANRPGPGFFPFYLGLLLFGVSLIIFFQGLKQRPGAAETGLKRSRVFLALAAVFIYAFVMEIAGYLLSTFFLMLLLLRMMVRKDWWFAPLISLVISLGSYALFKVWLQVLLPRGVLGF